MTDAKVRNPNSPVGQPRDELRLSQPALAVLAARDLRRDTGGRLIESTGEMLERVASQVAAAEDPAHGEAVSAASPPGRATPVPPQTPTSRSAPQGSAEVDTAGTAGH